MLPDLPVPARNLLLSEVEFIPLLETSKEEGVSALNGFQLPEEPQQGVKQKEPGLPSVHPVLHPTDTLGVGLAVPARKHLYSALTIKQCTSFF